MIRLEASDGGGVTIVAFLVAVWLFGYAVGRAAERRSKR